MQQSSSRYLVFWGKTVTLYRQTFTDSLHAITTFVVTRMAEIKIPRVCKGVEQLEPSFIAGGGVK